MDYLAEHLYTASAVLGEGPVWDARRRLLWWVDIERGSAHCLDPLTGTTDCFEVGEKVGCLALCTSGKLLFATRSAVSKYAPDERVLTPFCELGDDRSDIRMNDGKCDSTGRFWVGTMSESGEDGAASLYSITSDGTIRQQLTNVGVSNGLAWNEGETTMYYIDTKRNSVDGFDFNSATGHLGTRRTVFKVPSEAGWPDGMTIDREGMLWIALFGGGCILRVNPNNREVIGKVELPVANVTSCTFGGNEFRELYVTTARHGLDAPTLREQPAAGDLFVVRTDTQGFPADRFLD
jgi:sugar lactone lactonase YvrE